MWWLIAHLGLTWDSAQMLLKIPLPAPQDSTSGGLRKTQAQVVFKAPQVFPVSRQGLDVEIWSEKVGPEATVEVLRESQGYWHALQEWGDTPGVGEPLAEACHPQACCVCRGV